MVRIYILLLCMISAGCMAASYAGKTDIVSLEQISRGMTKEEIARSLDKDVVIGYEITNIKSGAFKPIVVKNPQRTQIIRKSEKVFEVVFYLTHVKQSDSKITDDELTPLIFENNKLVGEGWHYLNSILREK